MALPRAAILHGFAHCLDVHLSYGRPSVSPHITKQICVKLTVATLSGILIVILLTKFHCSENIRQLVGIFSALLLLFLNLRVVFLQLVGVIARRYRAA